MFAFRSEEHATRWSLYDGENGQIMPAAMVVGLSGHPLFSARLQPDYHGRQKEYVDGLFAMMAEMAEQAEA